MTYTMLKESLDHNNVNFVPHTLPVDIFTPMTEKAINDHKLALLGAEKKDHFVGIWVNRNAKRKRPNDVLESWKLFLDDLYKKEGHKKAVLIMHKDPRDHEGPNLISTAESLNLEDNIVFSSDRIDFHQMNVLYNISDFCINISFAEGFGLGTLESMMTGTPIIATCTGGMTRQVVDHRDNTENGVALPVEMQTMVGSQGVPYIYEDYVSNKTASKAIMKMYTMSQVEKKKLSLKVLNYARSQFSYQKMINTWSDTLLNVHKSWKKNYRRWEQITL